MHELISESAKKILQIEVLFHAKHSPTPAGASLSHASALTSGTLEDFGLILSNLPPHTLSGQTSIYIHPISVMVSTWREPLVVSAEISRGN